MDSWIQEKNRRRREKFGFGEFPPTDAVFPDGEFQYFITIAPPDADLDELRRFRMGESSRAGTFFITEAMDLFVAIFGLIFRKTSTSMIAISRAPLGGEQGKWGVVLSEVVSTLDDENAAEVRLGEMLRDWEGLKLQHGW